MKNLKNFSLYENNSRISDKERERLKNIEKNKENFISQFKEMSSKGKAQNFLDHYNVLMYIQEEPDLMASILMPLTKDDKFNEWLKSVSSEIPDSFNSIMGTVSDLKKIGF